jgi:hypothetical protein
MSSGNLGSSKSQLGRRDACDSDQNQLDLNTLKEEKKDGASLSLDVDSLLPSNDTDRKAASDLSALGLDGLYCKHLQLVKDALELESSMVEMKSELEKGFSIKGPLGVLDLKKEVLTKLANDRVVSRKRAEALLKAATLFEGLAEQNGEGIAGSRAGRPAVEPDQANVEQELEAGFFTSLLNGDDEDVLPVSPEAEPPSHEQSKGRMQKVYLVTSSYVMVPVEGRTSAVGYGHVEIQNDRHLCHVAKGGPCSEYSRRAPTKGAKYCDHTLMALWGLKGDMWKDSARVESGILAARGEEQLERSRARVEEEAKVPKEDQVDLLGFFGDDLLPPPEAFPAPPSTKPDPAPHPDLRSSASNEAEKPLNEWGALPLSKKREILYLLTAVKIPRSLPKTLLLEMQARHFCRQPPLLPACSETCPNAWPKTFQTRLDTCPYCQGTLKEEKPIENAILLDEAAILHGRRLILKSCLRCRVVFPPIDWQETGCAPPFANRLILTLKLVQKIRTQDSRGCPPTTTILSIFDTLSCQLPPGESVPKVRDVYLAFFGIEGGLTIKVFNFWLLFSFKVAIWRVKSDQSAGMQNLDIIPQLVASGGTRAFCSVLWLSCRSDGISTVLSKCLL